MDVTTCSNGRAAWSEPTFESLDLVTVAAWSAPAEALVGWSAGDVKGKPIGEILIAPSSRPAFESWAKREQEGELDCPFHEITAVHRDGTEFPALLKVISKAPSDQGPRYRLSVRALGERVQPQEEPFRAVESIRVLLETLPVGVIIADRAGNIVQSNAEAQRIWSGARYVDLQQYGEYKGWWPNGERVHAHDWAMARALNRGEVSRSELITIQPFGANGLRRTILNSASPIRDPHGEIIGAVAVNQDVTELEQVQAELRSAQQELGRHVEARTKELRQQHWLLQYIINMVPHAIFWKDRKGRFLGGNDSFISGLGLPSIEAILGKTDYDFFPREQAEHFRKCDFAVMATEEPMLDIEEPQRHGERGQRVLLTSKVPLRDESGVVMGLLGIYADITERKRMEEELEEAKKGAEAAALAKSEFLTTVSHELRTPLSLILGPLASLLASSIDEIGPRVRADLERIQRNARRLHRLVNDILDHQKIEAGKMQVDWEAVDVVELVTDMVNDARPSAESAGIDLTMEADAALGAVPLDRRKFEKIVLNLVGNALKFTPSGGRVAVVVSAKDGYLEVSVEDTGAGIADDKMHLLFQRFQQIDASGTRKHEGTGIGLSLVKELAELMGGTVSVTSRVGEGSRFSVRIPRAADRLVAPRAPPSSPSPSPGSQRSPANEGYFADPLMAGATSAPARRATGKGLSHLLVAEDNPDMRSYLAELLSADHDVELTTNGKEALAAAEARRPDVIISDVMMPEMDGFELVQRLKQSPDLCDIPIILLTARASRTETVGGLDVGADDYLSKPFDPAELKARVRAAERLHRAYLDLAAKNRELDAALRRLSETQEELVQAGKMAAVGTLVAGLSHELNNPVAIILMTVQRLFRQRRESEGTALDPALDKALRTIEAQANRCSGLVRTLLEYSRRKPCAREPCDIRCALDRALEISAAQARERGIHLDAERGDGALPAVLATPAELDSALLNVIGNALDAVAEGGAVVVGARPITRGSTPGVEISVRDTGCGISAEDLHHIFDPFFTTKPPGRGTGLGLSLTRRFFEKHQGEIHVESEVDKGTTVLMWLPEAAAAAPDGHEGGS